MNISIRGLLNELDLQFLRSAIERITGVRIESMQSPMIEARLTNVARAKGYAEAGELLAAVRRPGAHALLGETVEALVNNETSFFRDLSFFQALEHHVLPELIERRARTRTLTIWSAACSTGQEVYSLLMLLAQRFPAVLDHWSLYVLATDLSRHNLNVARDGVYRQFEINRGLPAAMLVSHFEQHDDKWQVRANLRERIEFARLNLLDDWPTLPSFDLILLRNVLLYMDDDNRAQVLRGMTDQLRDHGLLGLGGGEIFRGDYGLSVVPHGRWTFLRRAPRAQPLTPEPFPPIPWPEAEEAVATSFAADKTTSTTDEKHNTATQRSLSDGYQETDQERQRQE